MGRRCESSAAPAAVLLTNLLFTTGLPLGLCREGRGADDVKPEDRPAC